MGIKLVVPRRDANYYDGVTCTTDKLFASNPSSATLKYEKFDDDGITVASTDTLTGSSISRIENADCTDTILI